MKQLHNIEHHKIAVLPERAPDEQDPHWGAAQQRLDEITIPADAPLFDGPGPTAGQVNQQDEKDSGEE